MQASSRGLLTSLSQEATAITSGLSPAKSSTNSHFIAAQPAAGVYSQNVNMEVQNSSKAHASCGDTLLTVAQCSHLSSPATFSPRAVLDIPVCDHDASGDLNYGSYEVTALCDLLLSKARPRDEAALQSVTSSPGRIGTEGQQLMSMPDSDLPDPHHQDQLLRPKNLPAVDCGGKNVMDTVSFNDSMSPTEQIPELAEHSTTADTPSNISPPIKKYFQASKRFAENGACLMEKSVQDLMCNTNLDLELPDIQLASSTRPLGPTHILRHQIFLQSTSSIPSSNDDLLDSHEAPASLPGKIAESHGASYSSLLVTSSSQAPENEGEALDSRTLISNCSQDHLDTQDRATVPANSVYQAAKSTDGHLPETQLNLPQHALSVNDDAPACPPTSQISINTQSCSKTPRNKISCKERKRIIISPSRPPNVTSAMINWAQMTNWLLDPFREDEDCWFHPCPPPARLSISGARRPVGKLQKRFAWRDTEGRHSVVLNYGIVVKLINYQLTKQQEDGLINKQWHLSHLCGNWTCLNSAHTTVEPGHVNISRNNCFSHRSGCLHIPKCLKDKKVALGADGKLVDHSCLGPRSSPQVGRLDDGSSRPFIDDQDFNVIDFDDSESVDQDCITDAPDFAVS